MTITNLAVIKSSRQHVPGGVKAGDYESLSKNKCNEITREQPITTKYRRPRRPYFEAAEGGDIGSGCRGGGCKQHKRRLQSWQLL